MESWSQTFLAETVETGDKNRGVTDNIFRAPCKFCEKSLGKINTKDVELFRNGSVHEFYRLIAGSLFSVMIEMSHRVHHGFALS